MTTYNLWDVVVVPFPFTGGAQAKPRPALVISKSSFNEAHQHCLLAMITTAADTQWPTDIPIHDLAKTGLQASSVVRLKLFTLDNRLIKKHLGIVSGRDRAALRSALEKHLL